MPTGKKESLARWAEWAGLTGAIGLLKHRSQLIVLNYHRIGVAAETPFDPGVFSATPEAFSAQLSFLEQHFEIIDLSAALSFVEGGARWHGTRILITFDDGYRDNHDLALPVLRAHGKTAVFFLCAGLVGTRAVPWWDEIAYLVKNCSRDRVHLRYPDELVLGLDTANLIPTTRRILGLYKSPEVEDKARFLGELRKAFGIEGPVEAEPPLFMSWSEARALVACGMDVGSHTQTHPLLASLEESAQFKELEESKEVLEQNLGVPIEALAYPVGKRNTFSDVTVATAIRCGYRAAFSYYGGFNRPGHMDRFDIRRQSIETATSMSRFRLQLQVGAATAAIWF